MRVKCESSDGSIEYSDYRTVNVGTPQGSVFGPLIFLIFNNNLYLNLSCSNCILFTDDTTIYSTHKDTRHLALCIHEDLSTISDWFWVNKLTLNLDKLVLMLFEKKGQKTRSPYLNIIGLPQVDCTKFLGLKIDD